MKNRNIEKCHFPIVDKVICSSTTISVLFVREKRDISIESLSGENAQNIFSIEFVIGEWNLDKDIVFYHRYCDLRARSGRNESGLFIPSLSLHRRISYLSLAESVIPGLNFENYRLWEI